MKTNLIKYSLSLCTSLSLYAGDVYTIDELIVKALENSPDLKVSSLAHKASLSRVDIAQSGYLPQVNLHLSTGKNARTNVPSSEMLSDSFLLGNLSLNQLLYDFGKTSANKDTFVFDSAALNEINTQDISNKKKDVKLAYYTVLQALALIDVQKENVKLNDIQLYRSKKYFEAGIRTKIDVSDAKVELIKAKLDLRTAEYDLKLAYAVLDKVVGFKDIANDYTVYSKRLDLNNLFSSLNNYPLNLSESVVYAYENRNDLKEYAFKIQSAQAQSKLASSDYYPELYFGAEYTKQKVDKFQDSLASDQWKAAINLDMNLYQGGATDALTQEKSLELGKVQASFYHTKLRVKETTAQAYIYVYKTKDTIELSQSLVEVSNEKFDQAGKRYQHGLSDFIELQQSRQGYIDAKASLVVNYYNYYQAIATLDNAIGK